MAEIELLFLGTGTSVGVPMIGCHCAVCSSGDPRDKRTRPSVIISYDGLRVLVDTTPELRLQCVWQGVDKIDAVVYTHGHADHIMGLDDVRRFNVLSGKPLDAWAEEATAASLRLRFDYAFGDPPANSRIFRPKMTLRKIDGAFEIGSRRWLPVPLIHGEGSVLGFRVGNLAYCTDVSAIPEESFALLEGLEILVLGALSPQKHPSHFTLAEATQAARRIGAARTFFTHIGHMLPHEQTNQSLPASIQLAYDGLTVTAQS